MLNQPTWKVLGGMGPEWVPVYDSSLYFSDLLPEFQSRGVCAWWRRPRRASRPATARSRSRSAGGFKWMDREAGFRRDVEVVKAVRAVVGNDVRLMVDANNGFDLETTERWLDAVGDGLFFVEEMFPEQIDRDLMLKEYLRKKGWPTRVADGESADDLDDFDGFIEREALDVYQPDVRAFGLTRRAPSPASSPSNPR